MKRHYRKIHFLIWLFLAPALLAAFWLALDAQAPAPVNDPLPTELLEVIS